MRMGTNSGPVAFSVGAGAAAAGASAFKAFSALDVALPPGTQRESEPSAPEPEEDFPWHDPALDLDERLTLAEGKPQPRRLMAAMAQLDCGQCGYV